MKQRDYGQLYAPEDSPVMTPGDVPSLGDADTGGRFDSGVLWSYLNEGRLNGVPVNPADVGLKIDNEDMLQTAFVLRRTPQNLLIYLGPDDKESQEKYEEILRKAYAGEAEILDEQRQFDPAKGRFVVWLRYDIIQYELHPRFRYLREE